MNPMSNRNHEHSNSIEFLPPLSQDPDRKRMSLSRQSITSSCTRLAAVELDLLRALIERGPHPLLSPGGARDNYSRSEMSIEEVVARQANELGVNLPNSFLKRLMRLSGADDNRHMALDAFLREQVELREIKVAQKLKE